MILFCYKKDTITYNQLERIDNMNEIVSFSKEIDFNNNIDKISSISIEHTICLDKDSTVKGDLIVSGTYRQNEISLIDTPFSYKIPVDIVLDSKYDLSNITIDIDNFTYDVLDNNKLKINVDLILDNLEIKNKEEKEDDEIININDLFLEKEEEKKLEIPQKKEEVLSDKEETSTDSLFANLTTSNETYVTYLIHIVNEEETLDNIMDKYKVSRTELEELNNLNEIKKGSKIIIPNSND